MLKSIIHSVLFIALVILVAYLFASYAPALAIVRTDSGNCEQAYGSEALEAVEQLTNRIAELENRIVELEEALAEMPQQVLPSHPQVDVSLSNHNLALLQALNCKLAASHGSSRRLLIELSSLETLLKNLPGDTTTLQREINLARTETAAGISSAADRLEVIWTLLVADKLIK